MLMPDVNILVYAHRRESPCTAVRRAAHGPRHRESTLRAFRARHAGFRSRGDESPDLRPPVATSSGFPVSECKYGPPALCSPPAGTETLGVFPGVLQTGETEGKNRGCPRARGARH